MAWGKYKVWWTALLFAAGAASGYPNAWDRGLWGHAIASAPVPFKEVLTVFWIYFAMILGLGLLIERGIQSRQK